MAERQGAVEALAVTINPDSRFWRDRRILITGHTGFKGSWMTLWLNRLGAIVGGVSLAPQTDPNLFTLAGLSSFSESHLQDIRDAGALASIVRDFRPEIIFHLAAQPLVLSSYEDPLRTFSTNVQGTANLLDAVRGLNSVRTVVAITTDKVYENRQIGYPFRETDPLGGHDPYSASKAASEIVIASYRDAFLSAQGVSVASTRAGNVIGGGDWSANRLIPDAVRAWGGGFPLVVRRPKASRPWQHVLEPLAGYLRLAEMLWDDSGLSGAYNFGPETHEAATVRQVLTIAREAYGRGETMWDDATEGDYEAGWLSLEIARARQKLGVEPRWNLSESISRTMGWYRMVAEGSSALDLCEADINAFENASVPSVGKAAGCDM